METIESIVKRGNWVVLDTETTGLLPDGEVVSIAVVAATGETLMNRLIKPTTPIPPDASEIHGIFDKHVVDAASFSTIDWELRELLDGRDIIIYNASFDWAILTRSASLHGHDLDWYHLSRDRVYCAMLWYADYWGDEHPYFHTNRWQRLSAACAQQGLPNFDAHGALADAQATRRLLLKILVGRNTSD